MSQSRIVVLGAGHAGITLCSSLQRDHFAECEITLVDKREEHELTPMLHLAAAGFMSPDELRIPIDALSNGTFRFIRADVQQIRPLTKKVFLDTSVLDYDVLAIALGASTDYYDIKGARENAHPFRSVADASSIYNTLERCLRDDKRHDIVVVGGGATGVSLSGALAEFIQEKRCRQRMSITLVERKPRILSGWHSRLALKAARLLRQKGVKIRTNCVVTELTNDTVFTGNGRTIGSSLIVWTAGVCGNDVSSVPGLARNADGRIKVNGYCQCEPFENVFAIGDIAAMKDGAGRLYPQLAQIGVHQARYLASLIANAPANKQHRPPTFEYELAGRTLSLGTTTFVGQFGNYVVDGTAEEMIHQLKDYAKNELTLRRFVQWLQYEELERSSRELAILKQAVSEEFRNLTV